MQTEHGAMKKIASFIVDRRALVIILFIICCGCSIFTAGWVNVENDVTAFLAPTTETRKGILAMQGQFTTFGTAQVMLEDAPFADGKALSDKIAAIDGVKSVSFDDTQEHYKDSNCLIDITFAGENDDEKSISAMEAVKALIADNGSAYIYTEVGSDISSVIGSEMVVVGIIAVIIVIAALLLTSRSFMEVPALLLTFGAAALLNLGTNFIFGTISFVANSVTLILQLALAIDYAVILCNRYGEERQHLDHREAMIAALSKAIPEVSASSLTTIGGLVAMCFMEFRLGYDLGVVLIKAILLSMLSVFLLMPGLLMCFAKGIDKTKHRSFIPRISGVGSFAWKTKNFIPPIFVVLAVAAFFGASRCPLSYNYSDLTPVHMNESQIALQKINGAFGSSNLLAVVVPSGSYENEAQLIDDMAETAGVKSTLGIAGVKVLGDYRLVDKIDADGFSELSGLDKTYSKALFAYYAARYADVETIRSGLDDYKVTIIDLFLFLHDITEGGSLEISGVTYELPEAQLAQINELYGELSDAKKQLEGRKYSRILVYIEYGADTDEAHELVSTLHNLAAGYYGEDVYVTGDATCSRDLMESFSTDTVVTSLLSALFVVIIIILTFRSVGLAVLLIAVIQGSIWINFSVPFLTDSPFYFVAYLIVSSIQMGANIDYAIVVSNRYVELRTRLPRREAVTQAINGAFPTLITSGTILASAGLLIGLLTSETTTSAIGLNLGRGTVISLILVLFVLPQVLLWGDKLIQKTKIAKRVHFRVPPRFEDDFEEIARRAAEGRSEEPRAMEKEDIQ